MLKYELFVLIFLWQHILYLCTLFLVQGGKCLPARETTISTKVLKISCPFISFPINYVCNKMLFGVVFPDRLKYSTIKPLHKNEDRCEISNYRLVSLLTSFSKIFVMVMLRRILKHITNYNILSAEQYGFRLGLRTDNAIYKLTTEVLNVMNLLVGGFFVI